MQQHELSHCLHLMMRHCVVCVRVREKDSVPYVPIMFLADSMCVCQCVCSCGPRRVVLQTTHEKHIHHIKNVCVCWGWRVCLGVYFYQCCYYTCSLALVVWIMFHKLAISKQEWQQVEEKKRHFSELKMQICVKNYYNTICLLIDSED